MEASTSLLLLQDGTLVLSGGPHLSGRLIYVINFVVAPIGLQRFEAGWREGVAWRQRRSLVPGSVQGHLGDLGGCSRIKRGQRSLLERWEKGEGQSESGRGLAPTLGGVSEQVLAQQIQRSLFSTDSVSRESDSVRGERKWTKN